MLARTLWPCGESPPRRKEKKERGKSRPDNQKREAMGKFSARPEIDRDQEIPSAFLFFCSPFSSRALCRVQEPKRPNIYINIYIRSLEGWVELAKANSLSKKEQPKRENVN